MRFVLAHIADAAKLALWLVAIVVVLSTLAFVGAVTAVRARMGRARYGAGAVSDAESAVRDGRAPTG